MTLQEQYKQLEANVHAKLKEIVKNSTYVSKHVSEKTIEVDLFDYTELTIINDRLTFLNKFGWHHSLYAEASLEDLIDIITHNTNTK